MRSVPTYDRSTTIVGHFFSPGGGVFKVETMNRIGNINLSGAGLCEADLFDADLSGASLEITDLGVARLARADKVFTSLSTPTIARHCPAAKRRKSSVGAY